MKYIYRVPVLMCKDNRKKSYFGGFDYSFILDNKKEFINKTINIYALKRAGRYISEIEKIGEDDFRINILNGVKVGEFTITDIVYNIADVLTVEGVVDSEYHIGSGVFKNLGFKVGGIISSKDGIKEMLSIDFIYIFDIVKEYKLAMYKKGFKNEVEQGMENTTITYLEKKKRKHLNKL